MYHSVVSRAALAVWLAVLVLWQTLGHMHGVLHAPALNGRPAAAQVIVSAVHSPMGDLFGTHADDSVCRLLDQLAGGHALTAVLPVLPMPLPAAFLVARRVGEALARWAALFDARGPPGLR